MEIRDRRSRTVIDSTTGSLKKKSYITRFGLDFNDDAPPFRVGEVVDGSVVICLNSPIVIRRIRVSLECHILVDQSLESDATLTTLLRGFASNSSKHRKLFSGSCVPFGDELDYVDHCDEENFVLRPGQYEYLFEISLPKDLPPTVSHQPHLNISYICTACVEYGEKYERVIECSRLLNVTRNFDLKELQDLSWMQPSTITKEFKVAEYFPDVPNIKGSVTVNIALDHSFVTTGNRLKFTGCINSNCNLHVDNVEALIMQFIQKDSVSPWHPAYQSSPTIGRKSESGKDESFFVEHIVASTSLGSIQMGGVLSVRHSGIEMPADHAVVPPGKWMMQSFKCTYRFVLRIVLKAESEFHIIHVAAPLSVGNCFTGSLSANRFSVTDAVFS